MDLGANEFVTFRKVTLPLIMPGILAGGPARVRALDRRLRDHVLQRRLDDHVPALRLGRRARRDAAADQRHRDGDLRRRGRRDDRQHRAPERRTGKEQPSHDRPRRRSSRPHATTCGCTSRAWAPTETPRCRSSCAATAATSRTRTASATSTRSPACSPCSIGYSHGDEIGQAAHEQMRELPFYTNWSYAHPRAIELAAEVATLAPGDLNRVFFVSGGSEAVESAWKLARQYHAARGERRWKAIVAPASPTTARRWARSRSTASPALRDAVRAARARRRSTSATRTATTARRRRPRSEFTAFLLDDLEQTIVHDGPGDGRDGDHGAGPERGRRVHAAGRLLRRACARSATATGSCSAPTR